MNRMISMVIRRMDRRLERVGARIVSRVAALEGFGLILFFWTLLLLLLAGLVLIFQGLALWNHWLVLTGLMSFYLLGRLLVLGARHLRWLDL
jgi:hypothetical protein